MLTLVIAHRNGPFGGVVAFQIAGEGGKAKRFTA